MASLKASSPFFSCCSSSASFRRTRVSALISNPNVSVSKILNDEFNRRKGLKTFETTNPLVEIKPADKEEISNSMVMREMYAIMDIVADRAEMHKNIGAQRDNWNWLLLNSVNGMTVTASIMAGIAAVGGGGGASFLALKLSSSLLYMAATGVLVVMNKIQPSQLAEEPRNASRLFKKLHEEMKTNIALGNPDSDDVKDAMEKVLALDKAYPLPLLGAMLDKFLSLVQPAVWWPEEKARQEKLVRKVERNGWDEDLEEEMKEIVGILKRKDTEEYIRLSQIVLKINKTLAICGPFFTGIAALGSALMGSSFCGSLAAILGVVFGAMAIVVNSLEHGGQIGMVFEMYRSSAGFFRLMGETIESTLGETEADERENGELFEVKVALQLGRSLSELRDLADASHPVHSSTHEEFASKLF
ncbi:probable F-box protein At4g22030 [Herrania umbratica]|uniref:Probable F-box protein At4g22030 n=1 Tax=Herrania umbratica TaxID=108875 RepID=A0A6J1AMW4_9ROSI|nr:probable F-box protein At4g22030 [Herrania umbratica]